jgi:hypothetical protein
MSGPPGRPPGCPGPASDCLSDDDLAGQRSDSGDDLGGQRSDSGDDLGGRGVRDPGRPERGDQVLGDEIEVPLRYRAAPVGMNQTDAGGQMISVAPPAGP